MYALHSNELVPVIEFDVEQMRRLRHSYGCFLKVRRRSESHQDRVNRSLCHFERWLTHIEVPLLSLELIEDYALYLMEEARPHAGTPREGAPGTLAVASQRAYLVDLRSFLRWCANRGFAPPQARSWVPVPPPPKKGIKRASNLDISRILEVAREDLRDYALCCLLIDCGLRAGELATLRIEYCDLDNRAVSVIGKSGFRTVAISINAAEVLRRWLDSRGVESGYVFPGRKAGHLSSNGIYQIMMRLRQKADVKGRVNPHSWRHAYISNTAVRGGNAALTQIQAGHSSIATTEEYFGFGMAELREYQDRVTSLPDLMPDAPLPEPDHQQALPRPTRAELEQALQECPNWEALGRRYGVTGAAVKKWAKRWQLLKVYSEAKQAS